MSRTKDLSEADLTKLRDFIDKNLKTEGNLRQEVLLNIKRLKEIGSYRGIAPQQEFASSRSAHQDQLPHPPRQRSPHSRSGRKKSAEKT
jgi:hypothetical protein